jgi:ABC-2 type transport system ATP-binding protein
MPADPTESPSISSATVTRTSDAALTTEGEADVVLRTHGLRRNFGSFLAVDGLDLTVRRGEIYGFLGQNGAGKTTTIRMLMGIIKPSGGEIELLGERARRTSISQKRQIGYVSQHQHFYPWMTCTMLGKFVSGFYPDWDHQEFNRLLKVLDLPGYRRFSHLSGGMRMKLALAIALTPRPALLILDEPTSGLDPVAQREFIEIIQHQAREHGRTTFFSTHRIEEVDRAASQIGIIDQGKMRFEGPVDQLRDGVRRVTETEFNPDPTATPREHPWTDTSRFEVLSERTVGGLRRWVVKTDPLYWKNTHPVGYRIEPMSLEDIFIAYASVGGLEKL